MDFLQNFLAGSKQEFLQLSPSHKLLRVWGLTIIMWGILAVVFANTGILALIWLCCMSVLMMIPFACLTWSEKPWFVRACGWLVPNSQMVRLMLYDGEIRHTLAVPGRDNLWTAHVYWFNKVGRLDLYPNGVVLSSSQSSYVYFWEFMDKSKRVEIILQYPEFHNLEYYGRQTNRGRMNARDKLESAIRHAYHNL